MNIKGESCRLYKERTIIRVYFCHYTPFLALNLVIIYIMHILRLTAAISYWNTCSRPVSEIETCQYLDLVTTSYRPSNLQCVAGLMDNWSKSESLVWIPVALVTFANTIENNVMNPSFLHNPTNWGLNCRESWILYQW